MVRTYFDFAKVRAGLLAVTGRLFGLSYTARTDVPVWHETVTAYDVSRTADGELVGRIYLDLHPREGKFKHAAQFGLATGLAGRVLPEGTLVCNFPTGLMIYWLTTNLWTTGQGVVTRKMMPRPNLGAQPKSSRTPPKEPPATPAKPTTSKRKPGVPTTDGTAPVNAGPPRRVKRKRSGGSKRR